MTLGEHQEAFSRDLLRLLLEVQRRGYQVRLGEAMRTEDQQRIYFQTGKSKTMDSMHLKKCAIDLHFTQFGVISYPPEFGKFWESLDPLNRWGGNFDRDWNRSDGFIDSPHFERKC
jgi:hypothetical protein